MKDVTHELTQFQRGLLVLNSSNGIMIDGDGMEGKKYHRRFSSDTMRSQGSDVVYYRTGEILYESFYGEDRYYVVYRTKSQQQEAKSYK